VAAVLVRRRHRPRRLESADLGFSFPYVANVCFRCFSRFKGMLQLFLMDVAKVDRGILHMLQVFQKHVAICSKYFICFQTYVTIVFYLDVAYIFTHMLQHYVPNVSVVSVICCGKCFFVFQLIYLDVAYVSHTCCKRMSQMFYLFQMYVAFECFMLQV
jgi:hypothetical protein